MTPKEFDTQIALGTIKWYTSKQIYKALGDIGEYLPDSVDKVVSVTKSPKLLQHILDIYPKRSTHLYADLLVGVICNAAFNLDHALKIITSKHLYNNCDSKKVNNKIIDAIYKGELRVERVIKC